VTRVAAVSRGTAASLPRRDLLKIAAAGAVGLFVAGASARAANARKLGLIFPPAGRGVPEEGLAMYGDTLEFVVETLGLETMTPDGYDAVVDRIGPTAARLAERGVEAIMLMGTSLSFYRGEAFNQTLTDGMRDASGLPAATMSTAIIDGLKAVGARRIAAATAYNDEVNGRLRAFLEEHDFDVLVVRGLGIEAVEDIFSVTQPQLIDFGADVFASATGAEAILVSCGGLRTLEILDPLEQRCDVPVVSSTPHALFLGAQLLGLSGIVPGYGRLLAG
jgi:arylmalonate decarboxylase